MMKFSTASYTSPIFTANRHQKRKTKLNNQQNRTNKEINTNTTNKKNNISSKFKTGALVSTAFLAGLGINYQINSNSNQKEDINSPKIEQVITKENKDSINTKSEKDYQAKDSFIYDENKQDSIDEEKEVKKEKTQAPKPKKAKTQPKEKTQPQKKKEVSDEDMEMMFMEMMFE